MTAFQRSDHHGQWWVDFVHRGKRIQKKAPIQTRRGAEAFERRVRTEIDAATAAGTPFQSGPTLHFRDYAERWMRDYVQSENRPSSVRDKEIALRVHLLPRFGLVRLDKITTLEVDTFKADLVRRTLAPKTVNNILTILRTSLAVAVDWGFLSAIPRIRLLREPERPFRYLSEPEEMALLAATPTGFWRTFVLFILHTGARFSEAAAITWQHVHLEGARPFVHICRAGARGLPGPTKSGKVRDVPLTPAIVAELARLDCRHDLVFPQGAGRPMMNPASELRYLHKFCRTAGVKPCGWHALRHTFGTRMAAQGIPIPLLQKLMGHADIKMTMRYVHVDPVSVRAAVATIERALPVPWHVTTPSPYQSPYQEPSGVPHCA